MTTKPEPEGLDLRPWGYAPGSYFFKCIDCPEKPTTEWPIGDKRSVRCEAHAREAMERAPAHPVGDAGGVTDADREAADAISVALLQCVPADIDLRHFRLSIADLFARHRLQSVAAATAAKDAEIAILRLELEKSEALQDGAYKAGLAAGWNFAHSDDEAGFQRARSSTEHVAELKRIRAALSEAREAGVKD